MLRQILPSGFDSICCGMDPYNQGNVGNVHDFIRIGSLLQYDHCPELSAEMRDFHRAITINRDRHYPRIKHDISEIDLSDKPVVIMAPGTSASRCLPLLRERFNDIHLISMNKAISFMQPHIAFIMERHALPSWLQDENGQFVPWVGESPLVTTPDASDWLADCWEPDNTFYYWMQFGEIPNDPRSIGLRKKHAVLWSYLMTPCTAIHLAARCGARKVVLVGHDFCMDVEGHIYPGMLADRHPSKFNQGGYPCHAVDGRIAITNPILYYFSKVMQACCYWMERNGIPVINASDHSILEWRNTDLKTALETRHETIVDFESGEFLGIYQSHREAVTNAVRTQVA